MVERARRTRWDVLVPVGVLVLGLAGVLVAPSDQPGFRDRDLLALVLIVAQTAPLLARRRWPLPVLFGVWGATVAYVTLRYPPITSALAGLAVATYSVAAYDSSRPSLRPIVLNAGLVIALVVVAVATGYGGAEAMVMSLLFVTAWVLGDRARTKNLRPWRRPRSRVQSRTRRVAASAEAATIDRERGQVLSQLVDERGQGGVVAHRPVHQDEWGTAPSTHTASDIPSPD